MWAMQGDSNKTLVRFLQYIPISIFLGLGRLMPFKIRGNFFAALGGFLIPLIPGSRKRIINGLKRVYPDISDADALSLCKKIGQNTGRTFSEVLIDSHYDDRLDLFDAKGPGLEVLRKAKAEGKGALIVSGHFGQWEAVRFYLKSQGMEVGGVYRKNSSPWYDKHFLAGIKRAGEPIVAKSVGGNKVMIRHLRSGGTMMLLVDQKFQQGHIIPFLGIDALTPIAVAELALRYKIPLIPAFGTRAENKINIHVDFEAPIKHSDALTMTREINDRISARILGKPEQWYWLHKRWDDTFLFDMIHSKKS